MAYVDLNAVRAGEAKSIEASKHERAGAREAVEARARRRRESEAQDPDAAHKEERDAQAPARNAAPREAQARAERLADLAPRVSEPAPLDRAADEGSHRDHRSGVSEREQDRSGRGDREPTGEDRRQHPRGLNPELFAQSAMLFHELTYVAVGSSASMNEAREKREVAHLHGARKTTGHYLAA